MCPHASYCRVSSYLILHTYICVLIPHTAYLHMCPHTSYCIPHTAEVLSKYVPAEAWNSYIDYIYSTTYVLILHTSYCRGAEQVCACGGLEQVYLSYIH